MARTGRPKLPAEARRTNVLRIRLTLEEREILEKATRDRSGVALVETSTWAREQLLALAQTTGEKTKEAAQKQTSTKELGSP